MRVVLAKQRKRRQPVQKPAAARRLDLKVLNPLRPILRWARAKFVRRPSWRAFAGWQAYYSDYLSANPSRALLRHSGPHVGGADRQAELIDALAAGRTVAMISAPPGCGKSRLALELARRIEREHPSWHAVFVRHDAGTVRGELPDLTQLRHVVFIVDDAHECPEVVQLLAAALSQASAAAALHLLCLTRSTARAEVARAIDGAFPSGALREIDLGRPSAQLVRSLIDGLLPQSSPHHRETIARFVGQSYFGAVLGCGVLDRETKLPQTFQRHDLRERICRETLRDAADGICPIESALRALAVYAALAPVPKARADVRDWSAQLSGLTPSAVDALIDRALKAGLVQEHNLTLTWPAPDLLADLILELACLDTNGKPTAFSVQLLEQLLEAEPEATVRNCASVGQLFAVGQETDLISKLVLDRARTITVGNQWDALKLLQTAQPLARRRPATVVELARILESRGVLRRNRPAGDLSSANSVEMAACALLMSAGEVDSVAVAVALGLGRDLYATSRDDGHSRDRILGELKAYCRFGMGRSLAQARAAVDTLRGWIGEPDLEAAALAVQLSAQFLTLEVESPHERQQTAGSGRLPLLPVPQVWAVRDLAMDTIARGMAHGDAGVQSAAVGALEGYAPRLHAADRAWSDQWLPQLTREMDVISTAITQLTGETTPLRVLAAAELLGWHWWAQDQEVLRRAGTPILRAIPDTDAYRLWKLLHGLPLPVHTSLPEPAPTGPEDRLQYVQAFSADGEAHPSEQARQLFDALDPRYPDGGAWRTLWLAVLQQSTGMPIHHRAGAVIEEFARRHPEVAWTFVTQADADGPLFLMLPPLLAELGKLDKARRSHEAASVAPGTRLEEAWLRALSLTSDLDAPERTVLARGLESADPDTVHQAADALLAADNADRLTAFRKIFAVIADRPTDSELWDLVLQRFVSWADIARTPPGKSTDEMAQVADELTSLLRAQSRHLRWGFQRHTRHLAHALAIIAVLRPQRLQEWMQREWTQSEAGGGRWSDESPLSAARLREIMRLVADSPAATQWIDIFILWVKRSPQLSGFGALGLTEICSLDDRRVSELAQAIANHPTEASQKAFAEFVSNRKKRERPGCGETVAG